MTEVDKRGEHNSGTATGRPARSSVAASRAEGGSFDSGPGPGSKTNRPRVDSLLDLTVFAAIVEAGSLSKAAAALDLSLALVSKRLSRLESQLDVRLINRSTRRLSVTESGWEFYQRCLLILEELHSAEDLIQTRKSEVAGTITVTSSTSFARLLLAELVAGFQLLHPKARVRLIDDDGIVNIIDAGVDLAIRQALLPDSSLIATAIATDYRIVCGAPSYLRGAAPIQEPSDIVSHKCVVFGNPPNTEWILTNGGESINIKVPWMTSTRSGDAAMAAANAGGGLVYASIWNAQMAIDDGSVINVVPGWRSPKRKIHAVYQSRQFQSPVLREFVKYLTIQARILQRDAGRLPGDAERSQKT